VIFVLLRPYSGIVGMTVLDLHSLYGKYRLYEHKRKATCFHMSRKNINVSRVYCDACADTVYGLSCSSGRHVLRAYGNFLRRNAKAPILSVGALPSVSSFSCSDLVRSPAERMESQIRSENTTFSHPE
jgi:hypothetical protein